MSLQEILPKVVALPRPDKVRLMEWLTTELADEESVSSLGSDVEYPIWSPYDTFEAAAELNAFLERKKADRK